MGGARGGLNWYKFAIDYLSDSGTLTACGNRVVSDVFAAVEQHRPEWRPDPNTVHELDAISKDITVRAGYGERTDKLKTPAHVSALKDIYAGHWLARQLAETADILMSPRRSVQPLTWRRRASRARLRGSGGPGRSDPRRDPVRDGVRHHRRLRRVPRIRH